MLNADSVGIQLQKMGTDPEKDESNIRQRGISFEQVRDFDWDPEIVEAHRRGPPVKEDRKQQLTLRLSPEVVD